MEPVEVRPAAVADMAAVNEIYNHYVRETHVTFDVEQATLAQRQAWFEHYGPAGRHRVFVACEGASVVGFTSSSRWRPKQAYETSVETSVYVAPGETGRGIGPMLYTTLLGALGGEDVHRAYAGIALPNPASITLHERFGFVRVARFSEQGRKFGRYWDVDWFELKLT